MIGLLDCNNFYVSCERVFRPDLINRPVAVLSNNDGCIIARSDEVKALGIPMGIPYFQVKSLLERSNAAVFSSNFALYGDISARVMAVVEAIAPKVEVYSIDEVFIDFTGTTEIKPIAMCIRNAVFKELGIPTSVGISSTKTLTKVANRLAKRNPVYNHVCLLDTQHSIDQALMDLDVIDLWGVGHQLSKRLRGQGVYKAYQLKNLDPKWMRQFYTVTGERLVQELNGISCIAIEETQKPRQSIQVSRSFSKGIFNYEELRSVVATYATRLGQKLRTHNLKTRHILVYLRTNHFKKNAVQNSNSFVVTLPHAVEDDSNLIKAAAYGLEVIYKKGYSYSKAGVSGLELIPRSKTQYDLFLQPPTECDKKTNLTKAVDRLNKRYGRGTVYVAACGKQTSRDQKLHNKSPAYTTCWNEIPRAKAFSSVISAKPTDTLFTDRLQSSRSVVIP